MQLFHLLATSLALAAASPLVERAPCPDYALINARGTNDQAGVITPTLNPLIQWTLGNVTNGVNYNVNYPADQSQLNPPVGSRDAIAYINSQRAACPNQRFALLGYSQGASVVANIIRNITNTDIEPLIAAVLVFGNPYQAAGQAITIDENGGASSRNGFGSLLLTDLTLAIPQKWVDGGKVSQVCYFRDPVCDLFQLFNPPTTHLLYKDNTGVQERGAQHLIQRLRR